MGRCEKGARPVLCLGRRAFRHASRTDGGVAMMLRIQAAPRLIDGFSQVLGYTQGFLAGLPDLQPAYETVRGDILKFLELSEKIMAGNVCTAEQYDQARYAVCAWIDE